MLCLLTIKFAACKMCLQSVKNLGGTPKLDSVERYEIHLHETL